MALRLYHFNPRSREGSDLRRLVCGFLNCLFQPTLPRGERHYKMLFYLSTRNFNPRSREGSDDRAIQYLFHDLFISTHAPARGATTLRPMVLYRLDDISTHAPARGATAAPSLKKGLFLYFNPRSREGSDKKRYNRSLKWIYFNPRSREGSDIFPNSH